jgi:S-adenosylmethionine hydrolase
LAQVPIVDITHEVRPQDIRAGSLALKRAAPYLAAGVVIAVVDPGVGTGRRAVAVRAAVADIVFVGPDNGLMVPAVDALGGPAGAVELDNPEYQLPSPGPTFAGRDVFAPAAAYLAAGGDMMKLGPPVDTRTLVRLPLPICREGDGSLEVEVTWVDRYGNVQLAGGPISLSRVAGRRHRLTVETAGRVREAGSGPEGRPLGADQLGGPWPGGPWLGGPWPGGPWPGGPWPGGPWPGGPWPGGPSPGGPSPGGASPDGPWPARIVHTYGDLALGELGVLVDSYGCLALSLYGASAADRLGTREQDVILLTPTVVRGDRAPALSRHFK